MLTGSIGRAGGARSIGVSPNVPAVNPGPDSDPTPAHSLWWRADGWPVVNPPRKIDDGSGERSPHLHEFYKLAVPAAFKPANWDPYWHARAILGPFERAFAAKIAGGGDFVKLLPPSPVNGWTSVGEGAPSVSEVRFPAFDPVAGFGEKTFSLHRELIELIGLMEYRPGMLQEGLEQADSFDAYFSAILTFNRISHPATAKLLAIAIEVGTHVVQAYKLAHNRPRPSQLCPTLAPPIDPPEHAAYPSGHATQAWLAAWVLDDAMAGRLAPDPAAPGSDQQLRNPLHDMARRIARNREVMGLHYPSDSEAGRRLAHAAYLTLEDMSGQPITVGVPNAAGQLTEGALLDLAALKMLAQDEWMI